MRQCLGKGKECNDRQQQGTWWLAVGTSIIQAQNTVLLWPPTHASISWQDILLLVSASDKDLNSHHLIEFTVKRGIIWDFSIPPLEKKSWKKNSVPSQILSRSRKKWDLGNNLGHLFAYWNWSDCCTLCFIIRVMLWKKSKQVTCC